MADNEVSLEQAVETLVRRGVIVSIAATDAHLSIGEVARRLDCSEKWVKRHKADFPNIWRMPGGQLRIPAKDVDALAKRGKLPRAV